MTDADIYGTEKDKVNCPFYWKIGACRHGERCTRQHNKPYFSQTILIPHMYHNPITTPIIDEQGNPLVYDKDFLTAHFEDFYEDAYVEFSKSGEVLELNVCDNVAEHLLGNVYIRFSNEEQAQNAMNTLKGRFYAGKIMAPEFSPVTDFREARCRQHEQAGCNRSGMCNFMHLKRPSDELGRSLFGRKWERMQGFGDRKRGGDRGGPNDRQRDDFRSKSPDRRNASRGYKRNRDSTYDDGFGTVAPVYGHGHGHGHEADPKRLKRDSPPKVQYSY
jgi:splicing factor U2AF subunit